MEGSQPTEIRLGITPTEALDFFHKLADDDEFRAELEADPATVLARYNIEVSPPEAIPTRIGLPSKHEIAWLLERVGQPDEFGTFGPDLRGYMVFGIVAKFAKPPPPPPPTT